MRYPLKHERIIRAGYPLPENFLVGFVKILHAIVVAVPQPCSCASVGRESSVIIYSRTSDPLKTCIFRGFEAQKTILSYSFDQIVLIFYGRPME